MWCRSCHREKARRRLGVVERTIECGHCGAEFVSAFRKAEFCSRVCKDKARDAGSALAREQSKPERACRHCGVEMPKSMRSDAGYCSEKCNSNANSQRRKAAIRSGNAVAKVDRAYIIERDNGVCHLCKKKVATHLITLDHIIPLSKGGEHVAENLAVAHLSCNASKRDRGMNDQLLLVG